MNCTFPNLSEQSVRAKAEHNYFYEGINEKSSQEDIVASLLRLRENIKTVDVPVSNINPEHARRLHLKEGENTQRYVSDTREFTLSGRITDWNYMNFLADMGIEKATEINTSPDSVITAGWGTKIHNTAQSILENLIHSNNGKYILKNNDANYGYTRKTKAQAMKEWGLNSDQYNALEKGITEIFTQIIEKQRQIDSGGKVKILTEQFLGDFLHDKGGTADVLTLFSNGAVGLFDFKTKSPTTTAVDKVYAKAEWDDVGKTFKLIDKNWLPAYAIEDFNRQLGITQDILKNTLKRSEVIFSRIVPIHVQFELKEGGKDRTKLNNKLIHLSIGNAQDKYLRQIPIKERISNLDLDRQIKKLEALIHNYEIEYQEAKGDYKKKNKIYHILQNKRDALNSLLLDKDVSVLYEDFKYIVRTYQKETGELVDIDNEYTTIDGEKVRNLSYLDWRDLNSRIDELKAYRDVLESSIEFATELRMEDKDLSGYIGEIQELNTQVGGLISSLLHKRMERTIDESDKSELNEMKGVSTTDKLFLRDKEFNQKVMRMLNDGLSLANSERRVKMQTIEREIKEHILNFQSWAKNNNKSLWQAYEMILGEKNLIPKYNKKLYETIEELIQKNDAKGLRKIYQLKEDADKLKASYKADFLTSNPSKEEITRWDKRHDFNKIITNPKLNRVYYEFRPEVESNIEYMNEKFIEISKPENKALLDFWTYWTDKMVLARDLFELQSHEDLPHNYLPWIRGVVNEMIGSGDIDLSNAKEAIKSTFTVTQDDEALFGKIDSVENEQIVMKNKIDIMTGVEKLQVPKMYMNPLKNAKGQIDAKLKTRDLPHALYMFLDQAYNYHYLTTIVEPHVEALRDTVAIWGQQHSTSSGKVVKDATGRVAKFVGGATDLADLFERTVKYHLYGKKLIDGDAKTAKKLLAVKSYHTAYQLGGSWLAWMGNAIQIYYNTFMEGFAGHFFTTSDFKDAAAVAMGAKGKEAQNLYKELVFFLEPNADVTHLKARRLKSSFAQKIFDSDSLFWGFRVAEHGVENITMYAMLKNYGILNGNIVKLTHAPIGTKSILDSSRLENGQLVIDGLKTNEGVNTAAYTTIRNIITGVAGNTKGSTNSENQYGAQMTLAGKMIMHYKSWLPGMVTQRLSNLRYNDMTKSIHMGTYRTFLKDIGTMDKGMLHMVGNQIIPSLGKLALATATMPVELLFKKGYKYKTNEARATALFEAYKRDNAADPNIQNITLEDFMNYQSSRIRALSAELFVMISLYLAYMAAKGDWDEDGVPDWKATWYSRTTYRVLNRARRELSFMISWDDWQGTLLKSPIPSAGVLLDAKNVLENTTRELGDIVWDREGNEQKGSGIGKYSLRMIPYYKPIRSIDILDKDFQDIEF